MKCVGLYLYTHPNNVKKKPFYKPHPSVRESDRIESFRVVSIGVKEKPSAKGG